MYEMIRTRPRSSFDFMHNLQAANTGAFVAWRRAFIHENVNERQKMDEGGRGMAGGPGRISEIAMAGRTRERNDVADVAHTRAQQNQAFKTKPKSSMRRRAVFT